MCLVCVSACLPANAFVLLCQDMMQAVGCGPSTKMLHILLHVYQGTQHAYSNALNQTTSVSTLTNNNNAMPLKTGFSPSVIRQIPYSANQVAGQSHGRVLYIRGQDRGTRTRTRTQIVSLPEPPSSHLQMQRTLRPPAEPKAIRRHRHHGRVRRLSGGQTPAPCRIWAHVSTAPSQAAAAPKPAGGVCEGVSQSYQSCAYLGNASTIHPWMLCSP
ncbi:hypothetical protein J3F84DRAFT_127997 [Trichoderma pleuroticola]